MQLPPDPEAIARQVQAEEEERQRLIEEERQRVLAERIRQRDRQNGSMVERAAWGVKDFVQQIAGANPNQPPVPPVPTAPARKPAPQPERQRYVEGIPQQMGPIPVRDKPRAVHVDLPNGPQPDPRTPHHGPRAQQLMLNPPPRTQSMGRPGAPPMPENSPPPNPRPPAPPMPTGGHPRPGMPPMAEEQWGPSQPVRPTRDKLSFDPVAERPQAPSFDPAVNELRAKRDRLLASKNVSDEDAYQNFRAQMAGMPEPVNTPRENMEDTRDKLRRQLAGKNVKALLNEGPEGLTAEEQGRVSARIQNKGQVDELSNLNGRLAGLLGANQAFSAKQDAEDKEHVGQMHEMFAMQEQRAKEAGKMSYAGTPISSRRIEGTDNGWGKEQTAGGMRRKHIRDREAARKENVNRAKAAARDGEKFKQKLTGHDETDQYVGGAVASIQNTISKEQEALRRQLMAADAASEGKLGYIKGIQQKETAEAAFKNQLKGEKKKRKGDAKQYKTERADKLEDWNRTNERTDRLTEQSNSRADAIKKEEREYQEGLTGKAWAREDSNWDRRAQHEENLETIRSGGKLDEKLEHRLNMLNVELGRHEPGTPEHRRISGELDVIRDQYMGDFLPENNSPAPEPNVDQRHKNSEHESNSLNAKAARTPQQRAEILARSILSGAKTAGEVYQEAEDDFGQETLEALRIYMDSYGSLIDRQNPDTPQFGGPPGGVMSPGDRFMFEVGGM